MRSAVVRWFRKRGGGRHGVTLAEVILRRPPPWPLVAPRPRSAVAVNCASPWAGGLRSLQADGESVVALHVLGKGARLLEADLVDHAAEMVKSAGGLVLEAAQSSNRRPGRE